MGDGFYVYTHARPDGSVFYVGKGKGRRAWDFSPTRRSVWHRNIAKKYGLAAIIVTIYPAQSEQSAFDAERRMIADFKSAGVVLINLTDGGEGAAGHIANDAQAVALGKGRGPNKDYSGEWFEKFLDAGRLALQKRARTPKHLAHAATLRSYSLAEYERRETWVIQCQSCGADKSTKDRRTRVCSKLCEQRLRRAKEKAARDKIKRPDHSNCEGFCAAAGA